VPQMAKNMSGAAYGTEFQPGAMKQTLENNPFERLKYEMGAQVQDTRSGQQQQVQDYYNDPRINQLYGQQQGALGQMGAAGERFQVAAQGFDRYAQNWGEGKGGLMDMIGQQARGQSPSLADKYGAIQRQQAQGDIARQAAMSSRGGTDLASRRAAIMGASNVGANMAGQIAASRVAERQQAMQQYLGARAQQAQIRETGMRGMAGAAGMGVSQAGAYNAPMQQAQLGYGGAVQAGQTDYAQKNTAGGNLWAEPGSGQ